MDALLVGWEWQSSNNIYGKEESFLFSIEELIKLREKINNNGEDNGKSWEFLDIKESKARDHHHHCSTLSMYIYKKLL